VTGVPVDGCALALFGAPLAHEDHAQRAVLAALALQQRLYASHPGQALPLGVAWGVRIGLHTGQILIGSLGDDGPLTFTAAGDTTHLATWLAQQEAPGTILVRGHGAAGAGRSAPGGGPAHGQPRAKPSRQGI
jgi:class 3 adenylate cyclase